VVAAVLVFAAGLLRERSLTAARATRRVGSEDVGAADFRKVAGMRPDAGLLFNGWGITPAGEHVTTSDLALKMVVSPDGRLLACAHGGYNDEGLTLIDLKTRKLSQFLRTPSAWNGLAFSLDGRTIYLSGGASGIIHTFSCAAGKAEAAAEWKPLDKGTQTFLAGIAVHPKTGQLYVCNEANQEVLVLNPSDGKVAATIPVGPYPHSAVFGQGGKHLYVSNWGGRSLTLVGTEQKRRLREIAVGIRPNDMTVGPDERLFVACAGDNTVHVIDTRGAEPGAVNPTPGNREVGAALEILSTSLYPAAPEGSTPCGVAVAPDGHTLYVANADNNAVMMVDISDRAISRVMGFIPVGWYPTAVAVTPDSGTLLAASGKGLQFRANYPAQTPSARQLHKPPPFDYIGKALQGAVSFIPRPDESALPRYTDQVRANSPYTPETLTKAPMKSDSVIPDRVGEACPIKYVLYIIKENRTYDQVFGDMKDENGKPLGNGDPRLVMFGEDITPNHHQIARDYVLLDNLYCNGEVSVDGHSWCDAAIATDWNERSWLQSYSRHGTLPGNRETAVPSAGFLWNLCQRHGVSYRCYGEGATQVPTTNRGKWGGGRDMQRVENWISEFKEFETKGELPHFMIMGMGENHTQGTRPGAPTPDACVASNDIALGKILQTASRSRFWNQMAIFVIEDDAQNGPDHVDAHRTCGLVISPWVKRRTVDSTLYTTASMIRTMELILGLPPLTQYDAGATPMFNSFQKRATVTAYNPLQPKVDLAAVNKPSAPGAQASARMDFDEYDRAPEDALNRILWAATHGPNAPYPAPIHRAVFTKGVRAKSSE
jgi:YVTN family beta-propeller protein